MSTTYRRGSTTTRSGARGSLSAQRPSFVEKPGASDAQPLEKSLKRFEMQFIVTPQTLRQVTNDFVEALRKGLEKEGATVANYSTWVIGWPTGKEKGSYIAVDLGGTNLRVCLVTLSGGTFEIVQTKYRLTEAQKTGPGQALFDFCGECLTSFFLGQFGKEGPEHDLPLGFTFSYPIVQERIDHAVLKTWTKGFDAAGVEGNDVAAMFRASLAKYKVPAKLVAVINDAVGTLMASVEQLTDHRVDVDTSTRIGSILGTGSNSCFVERVANIPKLRHLCADKDGDGLSNGKHTGLDESMEVCLNCEYSAFDNERESLPRTKYDEEVDKASPRPGEQTYEKMIAGHYLGEIFRLAVCSLIDNKTIFAEQDTFSFETPYCFDTAFLSMLESDATEQLLLIAGLFGHFFKLLCALLPGRSLARRDRAHSTTLEERKMFKRLAGLVGTRSARLSACGLAALVKQKKYLEEENGCGIAIDGSLYSQYPGFKDCLHEALVDILGEKGRLVRTYPAEDGSGVGAAIVAAMTHARKEAGSASSSQSSRYPAQSEQSV